MEIILTTVDTSQYIYKITKYPNSKVYKSWLETISGNRKPEFLLNSFTPEDSIQELRTILNEQGFEIEKIISINNCFFTDEVFLELSNKVNSCF